MSPPPASEVEARPTEGDGTGSHYAAVLGMASEIVQAADSLLEAMRGELGPRIRTREQAAPEIQRRILRYQAARRELIEYARACS